MWYVGKADHFIDDTNYLEKDVQCPSCGCFDHFAHAKLSKHPHDGHCNRSAKYNNRPASSRSLYPFGRCCRYFSSQFFANNLITDKLTLNYT